MKAYVFSLRVICHGWWSFFVDSKDKVQLQENKITHILSIHDNAAPDVTLPHIKYLCIQVEDRPEQDLSQHFHQCITFIHEARSNGGSVLVHCLAGVSRSVTVSVAYIAAVTDHHWMVCLDAVRQSRTVANPNYGFQKQLHLYQQIDLPKERSLVRQLAAVNPEDHEFISGLYEEYKQENAPKHSGVASPSSTGPGRTSGSYAAATSPVNRQSHHYT